MFAMNRVNRVGLRYQFMELETGQTRVMCSGKVLILNHDIHKIDQSWYDWANGGQMIQQAFSYLTPGEREFMMTGLLEAEFDSLFSEDGEEN